MITTNIDTSTLLEQLTEHCFVAFIPRPQEPVPKPGALAGRRWYSTREVAGMLGYGLSKTKMLVTTGQIRSIKDGKYRRILPEWVDEYINRRVQEHAR
jgi:excisionase family DNA binding protein